MSDIVFPNTLTNGTTNDADEVMANFNEIASTVNGQLDSANLAAALQEALFVPGDLKATARATAPSGWLFCDGSAVSRATHSDLYAAILDEFGAGDGSTTFNVPDLRGRVPVGVDGGAGRLSANDLLGDVGGGETHTLTEAELAPHDHVLEARNVSSETGIPAATQTGASIVEKGGGSGAAATEDAGGGQPHNNMQPYQVVNWLIKT